MPIPYWANVELGLYASNIDQHFQMLEQILMVFDPIVQIQSNDATFDWTKISIVELTGIRFEENYPMGSERRVIHSFLDFKFPIWIAPPADLKTDFVKSVFARIGVINLTTKDSHEIVAQLDALGIEYELLFSTDDLNLPDFPAADEEDKN